MRASAKLWVTVSVSAFLLAACTQPAAQVVHKGHQSYTAQDIGEGVHSARPNDRSGGAPGFHPEPASAATTESDAKLQSVAVADLPPPAAVKPAGRQESLAAVEKKEKTAPASVKNSPVASSFGDAPVTPAKQAWIWPVEGRVISNFGPKHGGQVNDGINISAALGEPVWAAAPGEVVYAGSKLKGYGNMVLIKHKGGHTSSYAHLGRITVAKYDRVKQGQIIGHVGATGDAKEPQLHFAIREGKAPVNPESLLPRDIAAR